MELFAVAHGNEVVGLCISLDCLGEGSGVMLYRFFLGKRSLL